MVRQKAERNPDCLDLSLSTILHLGMLLILKLDSRIYFLLYSFDKINRDSLL